jgi:flavin-binding protein dodecin
MPNARVTELSATPDQSFEEAINQGVHRATNILRNVESAWIKDMNVMIENGNISAYKINMAVTFVFGRRRTARLNRRQQLVIQHPGHARPGRFFVRLPLRASPGRRRRSRTGRRSQEARR